MNLETARLRIRDLEAADRPAVHAWRADPDVMRYLDSRTVDSAGEWLDRAMERNAVRPRLYHDCAVVLRPTPELWSAAGNSAAGGEPQAEPAADAGEVAGWISIGHSPDFLSKDWVVGYLLRREYQGHGYATEALRAVLVYAFGVLGVPRVYAECYQANEASARVMRRAGMRYVGPVASNDPSLGGSVRYVIRREDHDG